MTIKKEIESLEDLSMDAFYTETKLTQNLMNINYLSPTYNLHTLLLMLLYCRLKQKRII